MPVNAEDTEDMVRSLGWEDPKEEEMATHSSILAWKTPWTEELGRLYSPWGLDTTEYTMYVKYCTMLGIQRYIIHSSYPQGVLHFVEETGMETN